MSAEGDFPQRQTTEGGRMEKEIAELNSLWRPIRPYLARQVGELYGRRDGSVIEIGPFSGLAFELAAAGIGESFCMAVFPAGVIGPLREEAAGAHVSGRVRVVESDPQLSGLADSVFDLAVFRGAFFFPSFFTPDLKAVCRVLKEGGVAFVGGGFGRYTPPEVIDVVKDCSKELNLSIGRVHFSEAALRAAVRAAGLAEKADFITEGGLWVVLRKGKGER
jgi:SAM-dependent methyltransferase